MSDPVTTSRPSSHPAARWIVIGAIACFALLVIRAAWLCDDAYITLRTVRNVVAGDGMRWNLDERVQSFTHPLWMWLLSIAYFVTREAYFTTLFVTIAMSTAVVVLAVRRFAPTAWIAVALVAVLASSRSYVDYATSGLENPLTHLLLVILVGDAVAGGPMTIARLRRLALWAALLVCNRIDNVVLVTPILAAAWWPVRSWRAVGAIAIGFAPLVAWELVATIYFGFPLPNTAYAKLPGTISLGARLTQGGHYVWSLTAFDRVALLVIAAGAIAPFALRRRRWMPVAAAIALEVAYILYVGGDFMAGRFFTAPLLLAVITLAGLAEETAWGPARSWRGWAVRVAPAVLVLGLGASHGGRSTIGAGRDFGAKLWWAESVDKHGIADERRVYYPDLGLVRTGGTFAGAKHRWLDRGRKLAPRSVTTASNVGLLGWAAPRNAHIIDRLALTDLLLARLPPWPNAKWRPGHLERMVPDEYIATLEHGENRFVDPAAASYWDDLAAATRGPIWSTRRFGAMWRLNLGGDARLARFLDRRVPAAAFRVKGEPMRLMPGARLIVAFDAPVTAPTVELNASGEHGYQLAFFLGDRSVGTADAPAIAPGMRPRTVAAPAPFDRVVVHATGRPAVCAVAWLRVNG